MDFAYYFIASSTYTSTKGDSEAPGWCREYTSHKDMAKYVREKCNFQTIFAAQTQGQSVDQAVAKVIGKNKKSTTAPVSSADETKGKLAKLLRAKLKKALKTSPSQGFPRGTDPAARLIKKGYNIKMVQLPGSTLPSEVLQLGFNAMTNSRRNLWLNDVNAGLFKLEKIPGEDDHMSVHESDQEDTNFEKDQDKSDENPEEDEPEWHGLGSIGIEDDET
ncbi:uncharacterized protein MELLADRAFT_96250 [Melampsora larici-populina 98AG31]|uniref:Uncharacterized protein n=1 Tax=Melampsora larici-populina (strain 98AG31 / pathotype 3-4-7) TaxID=747676 RepID=F4RE37_MELLP|nr:uncharacterized protein MELLADRAFT_96250 [Melampsora larici-populina 98AG31]EGG09342.1 hypothetical protein MELLADRAFT_96250 [Melampsora larici-populina 98AG31]